MFGWPKQTNLPCRCHANFLVLHGRFRVAVTAARHALNGYQKGHCFYCFDAISAADGNPLVDVDHFFPWSLSTRKVLGGNININGVWNLVLSCVVCNRGPSGKFDMIPSSNLVARLHQRNEFLINSHHPLRETLIEPNRPLRKRSC
jgi:hypothetical protein